MEITKVVKPFIRRGVYSGYGKYSDPLKFFTLCYIAAICENHLFIFFLIYTQHPILTEKHRIVDIFADLLKKKNWNITWSKVFRPFAQYLVEAPFWFNTAMSLFGKDATSFSHLDLGILCHSSLQILSSSVRLDGKRWWTAIFRSLQRCSIGFKSGLWLGHSRTVTELLWSHSFVIYLGPCDISVFLF